MRPPRAPLWGLALLAIGGALACDGVIRVADPEWEYAPGVHEAESGGETGGPGFHGGVSDGGASDGAQEEGLDTQGTEDSGVDDAGTCIDESFAWEPVRPQLVFVLDASGSMTVQMDGLAGPSNTRWAVLHEVVRGTLQRHGAEVEFGIKLFPSVQGGSLGDVPNTADVCLVEPQLEHELAANAGEAVLGSIPPATWMPYGSTPMGAGLASAYTALQAADLARPRAVLLVADGGTSTWCGEGESPADIELQVAAALDLGVRTFVVGVDVSDSVASALELVAEAGGGAGVGPGPAQGWFDPQDAGALDAAIESIVAGLRSCEVQLELAPAAELLAPSVGDLALDEVSACDMGVGGYVYDPLSKTLELCGSSCEAYLQGETLRVESFCTPG